MIIYLHIPKCAGTSMMGVLRRNYGKGFFRCPVGGGWRKLGGLLPEEKRGNVQCLTGHIPWGMHKYFENRAVKYVTMLRHPVERVVSLFWFIKTFKAHPYCKAAREMGLYRFCQADLFSDTDNGMTRWISGRDDVGVLPISSKVEGLDLALAKGHIDGMLVGFVNQFAASIDGFADELGWHDRTFSHKMKTKKKPNLKHIPYTTRQMIAERNHFDMELYEYARGKYGRTM